MNYLLAGAVGLALFLLLRNGTGTGAVTASPRPVAPGVPGRVPGGVEIVESGMPGGQPFTTQAVALFGRTDFGAPQLAAALTVARRQLMALGYDPGETDATLLDALSRFAAGFNLTPPAGTDIMQGQAFLIDNIDRLYRARFSPT